MTTPLKVITIKRTHWREDGVFGVIDDEGIPFALTVELPYKDNRQEISSIPCGEYTARRFNSSKHPNTFEVTDVPNRNAILFHVANTVKDLQGCIGIGEQFDSIEDRTAVLMSKQGFAEFIYRTRNLDNFKLVVLDKR